MVRWFDYALASVGALFIYGDIVDIATADNVWYMMWNAFMIGLALHIWEDYCNIRKKIENEL